MVKILQITTPIVAFIDFKKRLEELKKKIHLSLFLAFDTVLFHAINFQVQVFR